MIGIYPTVAKIESEAIPPIFPSDHSDGSKQLVEGRFYSGSEVPRMANQCGGGSKERG